MHYTAIDKLFHAAIKSLATHDPYERKPVGFLKRANLTTTEELAKLGTESQVQLEKKIIALLSEGCERIEKSQVTAVYKSGQMPRNRRRATHIIKNLLDERLPS
jgi:hypothetical protein